MGHYSIVAVGFIDSINGYNFAIDMVYYRSSRSVN